jgi:hypothetical protein
VERLNGLVEWISEEICNRYLDCLVVFTSQGIQQTELSEEDMKEQEFYLNKEIETESQDNWSRTNESMEVQTAMDNRVVSDSNGPGIN